MDDREHDGPAFPQQSVCHQEALHVRAGERHARETKEHLLFAMFEQAKAGDEEAFSFLHEQVRCQNADVQAFLDEQACHGEEVARIVLQDYCLNLLLRLRKGDEEAAFVLSEQIYKWHGVAHEFLLRLVGEHKDRVAHRVLYYTYDRLLKRFLKGHTAGQAFFHDQLLRQNPLMQVFLRERGAQDTRVAEALLYPYYQSLLSQASKHEWSLPIFNELLDSKDESIYAFLLQQMSERNEDAARILWTNYRPKLIRYIYGIVQNITVAEDLVDESLSKMGQFPNKEERLQFSAWLHRVAYNDTMDYFRKQQKTISLSERSVDVWVAGPEDEECERDCLRVALQRLSKRARTCILMADVEKYSTQEIATALEIKRSTVTAYLARTRAKLKDYYSEAVNEKYSPAKSQQPSLSQINNDRTEHQTRKKQHRNKEGETYEQ